MYGKVTFNSMQIMFGLNVNITVLCNILFIINSIVNNEGVIGCVCVYKQCQ